MAVFPPGTRKMGKRATIREREREKEREKEWEKGNINIVCPRGGAGKGGGGEPLLVFFSKRERRETL